MNKIYYILITLFLAIQIYAQDKQEVFYVLPDQQIASEANFKSIEEAVDQQGGKLVLLDSIERDNKLFITTTVKSKKQGRSPYQKFKNKVGEKFPLELFGLKPNDKPIFINFWFTSCPPCIKEIPDLNALKETYSETVNFYAITFNTDEQVERFEKKRPVNFTHITNQRNALGKFGVSSYPMNMILDKDGTIMFVEGMVGYGINEFKYELNKLLKEPVPTTF